MPTPETVVFYNTTSTPFNFKTVIIDKSISCEDKNTNYYFFIPTFCHMDSSCECLSNASLKVRSKNLLKYTFFTFQNINWLFSKLSIWAVAAFFRTCSVCLDHTIIWCAYILTLYLIKCDRENCFAKHRY